MDLSQKKIMRQGSPKPLRAPWLVSAAALVWASFWLASGMLSGFFEPQQQQRQQSTVVDIPRIVVILVSGIFDGPARPACLLSATRAFVQTLDNGTLLHPFSSLEAIAMAWKHHSWMAGDASERQSWLEVCFHYARLVLVLLIVLAWLVLQFMPVHWLMPYPEYPHGTLFLYLFWADELVQWFVPRTGWILLRGIGPILMLSLWAFRICNEPTARHHNE
jgi:hypothetical protein